MHPPLHPYDWENGTDPLPAKCEGEGSFEIRLKMGTLFEQDLDEKFTDVQKKFVA